MATLDEAIASLAYSGTVNEKIVQWLNANGATSGSLQERWDQVLTAQSIASGTYNERKARLYEAAGFLGTLNEREYQFFVNGASLGMYIDSAAPGGGTGTQSSPYNTLAPLNALSGDQNGLTVYLVRGSVFTSPLNLVSVSNIGIEASGVGADPLISNYTTISSANWVDYTGTQADTWYMTEANWGGGDLSVILDDNICYKRTSIANLLLVYERAQTGANHPYTYFYDSGAARMYVHVNTGENPTTMVTQRAKISGEQTLAYAVGLTSTSGISITDVRVAGGRSSNIFGSSAANTVLTRVESYAPGNLNGTGQNCFNFVGPSRASKTSGLTLDSCVGRDAFGSNNNGLELAYLSGVIVQDCEFYDLRANAIEMWQSTDNITIRRNIVHSAGSFIAYFNQDGDNLTHHNGGLIQNNIFQARASFMLPGATGSGSPTGGSPVILCASGNHRTYSNLRVVNNSFYVDDAAFVQDTHGAGFVGGGNGVLRWINNVCMSKQTTANSYAQYENAISAPTTSTEAGLWVMDRNAYQQGRDVLQGSVASTFADGSIAALRTAWNPVVATNEDLSSLTANATNFVVTKSTMLSSNLRPHSGSAAMVGIADTGDADYPTTDITGATRTRGSAGAYD